MKKDNVSNMKNTFTMLALLLLLTHCNNEMKCNENNTINHLINRFYTYMEANFRSIPNDIFFKVYDSNDLDFKVDSLGVVAKMDDARVSHTYASIFTEQIIIFWDSLMPEIYLKSLTVDVFTPSDTHWVRINNMESYKSAYIKMDGKKYYKGLITKYFSNLELNLIDDDFLLLKINNVNNVRKFNTLFDELTIRNPVNDSSSFIKILYDFEKLQFSNYEQDTDFQKQQLDSIREFLGRFELMFEELNDN